MSSNAIKFEDMKVAGYFMNPEEWGNEEDPNSDWRLIQEICKFSHREACEFILYVGDDYHINRYEDHGLSKTILGPCRNAQKQGYKYICFYT